MKGSGIYKIYSISKPDRVYVGSAMKIGARKRHHFYRLRKGNHHSIKLQRHYNKYGKDDLVFVVIEPCFPEYLIVREQYYIDTLNPYFNICKVAGSTRGIKLSDEVKRAISERNKGDKHWNYAKTHSPETRAKISKANKGRMAGQNNPFFGKKHTDEFKNRMSELKKGKGGLFGKDNPMYGKEFTEEHKQKMRESRKGRKPALGMKHSDETKEKMSIARKGKKMPPRTDEHREKLSKALKTRYATEVNPNSGKKHSAERRKKNSEAQKGKKLTDEHKKKIAEMTKIALNRPETRAKLLNRVSPNKGKTMQTNICPHCNLQISLGNYARWHGDNCKQLQLN